MNMRLKMLVNPNDSNYQNWPSKAGVALNQELRRISQSVVERLSPDLRKGEPRPITSNGFSQKKQSKKFFKHQIPQDPLAL
jgi:hypothetical protein